MKVGDYVAEITSDWQKHNKWMEFPDEPPVPLGVIVSTHKFQNTGGAESALWEVLDSSGRITVWGEKSIIVINERTNKIEG